MSKPINQAGDRRPIASRDTGWARRISSWLAGCGVSPNAISVVGMIAGLVAGVALATTAYQPSSARLWWVLGAVFVQLRLLANLFDGMVAIETDRASAVGELYNEVPDRVSDIAILVGFGFAATSDPTFGYWAAIAAVFVAYIRSIGKVAGGEQEFCGPMAKPQRMFLVTIAAIYAAAAPSGWPEVASWTLWIIIIGCLLTGVRRLGRTVRTLKEATHR